MHFFLMEPILAVGGGGIDETLKTMPLFRDCMALARLHGTLAAVRCVFSAPPEITAGAARVVSAAAGLAGSVWGVPA